MAPVTGFAKDDSGHESIWQLTRGFTQCEFKKGIVFHAHVRLLSHSLTQTALLWVNSSSAGQILCPPWENMAPHWLPHPYFWHSAWIRWCMITVSGTELRSLALAWMLKIMRLKYFLVRFIISNKHWVSLSPAAKQEHEAKKDPAPQSNQCIPALDLFR